MGIDQCGSCKFVGYCTFPENRVITGCDGYEHLDSAPAFKWDLREFMRLWHEQTERPDSQQG